MQLLTLAGTLFLVVYSTAAPTDSLGPCTKAREASGRPMPGKYMPQCTQFGFFKATQCHGSLGTCWCVNPDTGAKIEGTNSLTECTVCNVKRSEALRPSGFVGNYVPTCDKDGLFETTQHHGSTGYSWCVDRYTGTEIAGTRQGPGQQPKIECGKQAMVAAFAMQSELQFKGPCYAKIVEARGQESMPGFYTPGCTNNGYYKSLQHHASTGYSWCVNPATGVEIPNTRRSPAQPQPDCGACFKEIEEKLRRTPLLGGGVAQCNEENGDYLPEQHVEGHRWCANPKTGAVEGKIYPPGDNTPLPCVNH